MLIILFAEVVEIDSYRHTLLNLDKVASRIVCRYQRIFRTGSTRNGGHRTLKLLVTDGIYGHTHLLSYIEILYLGFLIVGNHPFVVGWNDVGNGGSCIYHLSLLDRAATQFTVTRGHNHTVREIQLCHLYGSLGTLDGGSHILLAGSYLVYSLIGSSLLLLYPFEFLLGGCIFHLQLFELDRSSRLLFYQVAIALAVLGKFGKSYIYFIDRCLIDRS